MSTDELIARVLAPFFFPALSSQRIFWLYVAGALVLAVLAFIVVKRREHIQSGWRAFLAFCFPKGVFTHRSAIVDYKYFFINKGAVSLLIGPLVLGVSTVAGPVAVALGSTTGFTGGLGLAPGTMAVIWLTVLSVVAMDLAIFVTHYLQHKVPVLWEFHKIHHSAEVLTPITIYRMHPVDTILTASCVGLFVGTVRGIFDFAYAAPVGEFMILKVNAVLFAYYLLGFNLRHTHIWLDYPRALGRILVSPAQHQVHHSAAPEHADRNMGFILAIWDWMAGTQYLPNGREQLEFGLHGGEHEEFNGVLRLYFLPFRKLMQRFWRRPA